MMLVPLALTALLFSADPGFDTVFLQNGGRLRGTVVEESPSAGVTIQVPGGQLRTVAPGEVFRIEYRDGTVGLLGQAQPPKSEPGASPAPPASLAEPSEGQPQPPGASAEGSPPPSAPPAAAAPRASRPAEPIPPDYAYPDGPPPGRPPPPPAYQAPPPQRRLPRGPHANTPPLFMFAGGLGFMTPSGDATRNVPMDQVVQTLFLVELEGGLRFTPELMLSLYLDVGLGGAASEERAFCRAQGGNDCSAIAAKVGLQLRYAFTPRAPSTWWVSGGLGGEATGVSYSSDSSGNDLMLSGREWRLGTGVDFRPGGGVGWGLFMNVAFARFDNIDNPDYAGGSLHPAEANHTWVQVGARVILGP